MPSAQAPIPVGRLLDGQLGQRERLQPLIRNGPTAQHRRTVGACRQTSLRPLQGAPPVTQPLAQGLAGLLSDPAAGAVHRVLWAGDGDRVVVVARHRPAQLIESATLLVQQGSRPRIVHPHSSFARTVGIAATAPVCRTQAGIWPSIHRDLASIVPDRRAASTRGPHSGSSAAPRSAAHLLDPRGGRRRPARVIDQMMARCRRSGLTVPYSGRGACSPNRNDNSTKRRPAVTSRTSCRADKLLTEPRHPLTVPAGRMRATTRDSPAPSHASTTTPASL